MSYAEELAWLYGLRARGVHLNLDRMSAAVEAVGHPQRGLRVLHVAGSNGKGSVCAMLERSLGAAGYRTGLFTSPHLHRYAERVRIAGEPLDEDDVATRIRGLRLRAASLPPLTFFEHTALLAFEAFRDHEVEVVVLEVGLGGRLDATNVVEAPVATAVTRITLEHQRILGDTLEAIAAEKAGIFKAGAPAVIGVREAAPARVLRERATRAGASHIWQLGRDIDVRPGPDGVAIRIGDLEQSYRLALPGEHQWDNAAIAVATLRAAHGLDVDDDAIAAGLADARWPGRCERITEGILVDAAHNPDGCEALARLLEHEPRRPRVLLFGAMADKPHEAMLGALDDVIEERVYAVPAMRRAPESGAVFAHLRDGHVSASVGEGLALARELAGGDGLVVVAGSIFLVAEVRAEVLDLASDPPIGM